MPAVLWLLFAAPVFLVTYVALYHVITRNGWSPLWVALPLAVVALLATRAATDGRVSTGTGPDTFGVVVGGFVLACVAGWIALVVVACVRWSENREARRQAKEHLATVRASSSAPAARSPEPYPVAPTTAPAAAVQASALQTSAVQATAVSTVSTPAAGASTAAAAAGTAPSPDVTYCPWCGRARHRDAESIHHCGSRERPVVFCASCGRGLEQGAASCARCGAPTAHGTSG